MAETLNLGVDGNWAVKKDSLLAYNSENGNFKPLPFSFSRASSATAVDRDGLIEIVGSGEPRIDFLNDSKGALMLEPSSTNLIAYSEDFSNSAWNTSSTRGVNFIPTSTIDPQGKTNAYRMTSTASDNQVAYLATIVLGVSYSSSIYVKRVSGSGDVILRDVNNVENNFQVSVNDGWKRLETSVLSTSTNGRLYVNLQTVGDVIEIWGAQLEAGSYATSIITTQGAISTRVAEICSIDNLDDYVSSKTSWTATGEFVKGQDKGNSLYMVLAYYLESSNLFRIRDYINSVRFYLFEPSEQSWGFTANLGQNIKWSIRAKSDGTYSIYVNGALLIETSGTFRKLDRYAMYGNAKTSVNNLRVYNTALTDQELINLTTI
jgi:hypothetical protein